MAGVKILKPEEAPSAKCNQLLQLIPDQLVAVITSHVLESGAVLNNVEIAFKTWGKLNAERDNVLVVCHALTGSSDVEDWWGPLMGPGLAFDPTRWFIFCANVLGSPYGSSSPVSLNPDTNERYGPEFPQTTTRDDIKLHKIVLDHLGVSCVAAAIGGSMGGMAVLEWPLTTPPGYVKHIVPIATSARHSAWGISWGEAQRQSIYSDPKYQDGYYTPDDPPLTGLAAARMAALLTYRSHDSFESRFGRKEQPSPKLGGAQSRSDGWTDLPRTPAERALAAHNDGLKNRSRPGSPPHSRANSSTALAEKLETKTEDSTSGAVLAKAENKPVYDPLPTSSRAQPLIFSAQSYLRYQGDKFVSRFDANCYISITRKMDSHDLSRGDDRPDWPEVLAKLPPHILVIAISSDSLFTHSEMQDIVDHNQHGEFRVVESPEGHDGFLLEFEQINAHILGFLQARFPEVYSGPALVENATPAATSFKVAKSSVFGEAEADISRWLCVTIGAGSKQQAIKQFRRVLGIDLRALAGSQYAGDTPTSMHPWLVYAAFKNKSSSNIQGGNIEHMKSMEKAIKERFANNENDGTHLEVLLAATNSETLTYDGIDLCAERVVQEIDEAVAKLEGEGNSKVSRFSIVGYSLGGLIARYAIGLLHARSPSFFTLHTPVNFTTFASPAIGIPKYNGFAPSLFYYLGARLLSRSGAQMYATDDFRDGQPLIEVLADPTTTFVKALNLFNRIEIYANTLNDRTVPYPTAAMTTVDPFAKASRRTNKARGKRQAEIDEPFDVREGGLEVNVHSDYPPIVTSYRTIEPLDKMESEASGAGTNKKRKPLIRLPPYFFPSFYVFLPKPMRYAVVFGFPIVIPCVFCLIIGRFVIQGHSSRRRIKALLTGDLQTSEGRLRRVGLSDMIEEMINEQSMQGPNVTETPAESRSASPTFQQGDQDAFESKSKGDTSQPIFSQPQLNAIANLTNKRNIPKLEIILVFLPDSRNAHGTMICRTPSFMDHLKGIDVLRYWADRFVL